MALTSCTKFGPDEIQTYLGAGGMEEACKSVRDTRLDRIVAIEAIHTLHPQNGCSPRTGQGTWTIIRGTPVAFFWARLIHARFSEIRLAAREIRAAARRAWFVGEKLLMANSE